MLSKTKHGHSNLFKLFFSALPFSSKPLSSKTPTLIRKTPGLALAPSPSNALIISPTDVRTVSSDADSICLLLSNSSTEKCSIGELLTDFKHRINSDVVLRVLMNYRQLGRIKTLEFFSWAGMQMGFGFDDQVVDYMADFLGRRKLFDDLKCLLISLSSNNGRVSSRAVSICIRFLGRQGRVEEALCLFREMESKLNCKPDNLVFNNILYVLCKKESSGCFLDVAMMIFRSIESPDMYSYSNVLVGLCKFGQLETAFELFHEMCRTQLAPTRTAVNALIGEFCSLSSKEGAIQKVKVKDNHRPITILVPNVCRHNGAIDPAIKVFWSVHDLGVLPSVFVINKLVSEACRHGRMKEALDMLKVIEERKLGCLEGCYTIVVKGLCEHRLVDEISQLFGKMLSRGLKPKLEVYNSIISMLCKLGRLSDAERVFKIMDKNRCLPDSITYTMLIHSYGEAQNWEASYSLLMEMLRMGICPHFHTYSLVDKLLKENEHVDLSKKLEERMEMQILQKLCKDGELEAAYTKLNSMIEIGIHLPVYVKDAFESAFQKSGKLAIARKLLERMEMN
nr:pentatricopeptide repeat-containing protein At4g31850, chloroplastic-like isoform X1 [Ipomoea batatas]